MEMAICPSETFPPIFLCNCRVGHMSSQLCHVSQLSLHLDGVMRLFFQWVHCSPIYIKVICATSEINYRNSLTCTPHPTMFSLILGFLSLFSRVQIFSTPWTAACQASLSFTISQNLLKLLSIESVMPFNQLIPLLFPYPPALYHSQHQCFTK